MPTLKVTKYEGVKVPSSSWSPSLVSEAGTSAVCAVKVSGDRNQTLLKPAYR